ncbi:MAG TPA: FxSxx-COOH system tetratricopeptide repeat protein [Trebonia sp.]|nr:FxSxx-COOH system tetratricopeptide repeat protein [Trebonia sp.]
MTESSPAEEPRRGCVVTFYSYKGGTGRTMALANVAWILASNGHRVLVADWDLESPGLHRFFAPFLDQSVREAPGIIDMVREYEYQAAQTEDEERRQAHIAEYTRIRRYTIPLRHWTFPDGGSLEFLSPGKQNKDYMATISALDWDNFYHALSGGEFLDALRDEMKAQYDYALIDSRTGLSDVADICTAHLPDVFVDCFTLSTQGIEGSAQVAKSIGELHGYRGIRVLPVPMRVDPFEQERVEAGRIFAQRRFENLPSEMTVAQRRAYWTGVEVPYRPYYAYEEMLAVFGDSPGIPGSMLSAYERLTGYITDGAVTSMPAIDEVLRDTTRARFDRKPPLESRRITLEFLPEDQIWVEWIAAVLSAGGFTVLERRLGEHGAEAVYEPDGPRTVTVVSDAYVGWRRAQRGELPGELDQEPYALAAQPAEVRPGSAVYVGSIRSLPEFSPESAVALGNVRDAGEAVGQLARPFRIAADLEYLAVGLPRYPGADPRVLSGLAGRIDRFTGRENDLQELRGQLRSFSTAVVRPVALLGTAGVGKTAIALEYAHRFMNDYDLVCWIRCGRSAEVDTRVAEIAPLLERFGVRVPADATVAQRARTVLDVLGNGETVARWLLIYDNAEDIEAVRNYMPRGGGRVLITSQNQSWEENGVRPMRVRMLDREESLGLLLREVPSLKRDEANALADALGDLPVAIISVAAYLRDTGYPVARYLSDLGGQQPRTPRSGVLSVYPPEVAGAWDAPLELLRERSAASARLLELSSVMAPEVSLDLVYSRAMAEVLEPYDPALSEPLIMGRVVQEASKLNLITLDSASRQLVMHRVVQTVVRNRMSAEERAAARRDVQQILVAARPRRDVDEPATWSRYELLWPHLEAAEVVSSGNDRVRQLINDRVRYIYVFSDFDRGLAEGAEARARWEEMHAAAGDPALGQTLTTQLLQLKYNIGNILLAQSRFSASRELHAEVYGEQSSILGREHPHTLMTAMSLAADLRALGLFRDALQLDQRTRPAWVGLYGEENLFSLRAANNLAVSYRLTGDVRAALQLDRDTLGRLQRSFSGHPLTLSSARNLARDLLECGEYREAVEGAEAAYRESADRLGADSAAALDGQILLGVALRSEGKPEAAEELFIEALSTLGSRFGESASATLACRLSYAVNRWSLDHFPEAEEEIRHVLAAYERSLGPNHPHALVCRVNLAAALRQRLEPEQAATEISAARDGLERVLGPEHPYTLAAEMVDGVLLADRGDYDKAAELQVHVFGALARVLGTMHPDTLRARANLLLTRADLGDDTADDLRRAVGQLELLLGAGHPTVVTLRKNRRLLRALDPQPF